VRSAIFGATLGVAALTASLVFAASLGHLLDTPRLSGFTWDAFVFVGGQQAKAAATLRADPKIAGYTRGGFFNVRIGQVKLITLVLSRPGPARAVIPAGVPPAAGDEVALGASTMRAAHTAIGRTVDLVLDQAGGHPKPKPVRMRVVGTVIVPPIPYVATGLGDGEAVVLGEGGELVVATRLLQRLGELLQIDVADPLEEHQRKDVRLEVSLVDAAAEEICCLREILLQLGQGDADGAHLAPLMSLSEVCPDRPTSEVN
jgi:hypothetical protein